MLTERMKRCAEYYALTGIAKEDVEYLCKCKWEELPKEFFDYVKKTEKGYNDWCNKMATKEVKMKGCAQHWAFGAISKKRVEEILNCKWEDLPVEFFNYAEEAADNANKDIKEQIAKLLEEHPDVSTVYKEIEKLESLLVKVTYTKHHISRDVLVNLFGIEEGMYDCDCNTIGKLEKRVEEQFPTAESLEYFYTYYDIDFTKEW